MRRFDKDITSRFDLCLSRLRYEGVALGILKLFKNISPNEVALCFKVVIV